MNNPPVTSLFESAKISPKVYHPATFMERGVALPLTTPILAGSRARPADGYRLELIIFNPAGGRGVYVLPWESLGVFCRPTMHDCVFAERMAARSNISPTSIRRVAREIAAEGLAGEDASEAARVAAEADKADLILANYNLLMLLSDQLGDDCGTLRKDAPSLAEDPAGRLRLAVEVVAEKIGRSADWTAAALEDMAETMGGIGLDGNATKARLQQLMDRLRHTQTDIHRWATNGKNDTNIEYAVLFCSVANLTLSVAQQTIMAARALTDNMVELLREWASEPERIRDLAARPDWLLDGWERICVVWQSAQDAPSQERALTEIMGLNPVMPKEVTVWTGGENQVVDREVKRHRRIVPFNKDWLTGESVFDLIARNEQIRAATC